jgi:hypothetical protein
MFNFFIQLVIKNLLKLDKKTNHGFIVKAKIDLAGKFY